MKLIPKRRRRVYKYGSPADLQKMLACRPCEHFIANTGISVLVTIKPSLVRLAMTNMTRHNRHDVVPLFRQRPPSALSLVALGVAAVRPSKTALRRRKAGRVARRLKIAAVGTATEMAKHGERRPSVQPA